MKTQVKAFLTVFLMPCLVLAGEQKSPLQSQLESELLGKSFLTKIILGTSTYNGPCIDTEVSPDGTARYYSKVGGFTCRNTTVGYIGEAEVPAPVPAGTTLKITKIEFKDNRIELVMGLRVRLKLILGKGFETSYQLDNVLGVVSYALHLDRFEQQQSLKAECAQLKTQLASAESAFNTVGSGTDTRIAQAQEVQSTLRALIENRTSYDSLTQSSSDPEKDQYTRQAADVDKTIRALEQEARKQKIKEVRASLTDDEDETATLKLQLAQRNPASLTEWQMSMDLMNRYDEVMGHRQTILQQLRQLGEPVSKESLASLNDATEGQKMRHTMEGQRQKLQLAELEANYREMDRKRKPFLDSYTRAFGTSKQKTEGQKLALHLHQMQQNRIVAASMGVESANAQATSLQKEIDRLTRQIGPVEFPVVTPQALIQGGGLAQAVILSKDTLLSRGFSFDDQPRTMCSIRGPDGPCQVEAFVFGESRQDSAAYTCGKLDRASYVGHCIGGALEGVSVVIADGTTKLSREAFVAYFSMGRIAYPALTSWLDGSQPDFFGVQEKSRSYGCVVFGKWDRSRTSMSCPRFMDIYGSDIFAESNVQALRQGTFNLSHYAAKFVEYARGK